MLSYTVFGFFIALSFFVSAFFLKVEIKKKEQEGLLHSFNDKRGNIIFPHQLVGRILILAALSGLAGARLFSIFQYPKEFLNAPLRILFSAKGLTFYGGLTLGATAVLFFARKHKIKSAHLLDALAMPLILAYGIGRFGWQLAGYGNRGIANIGSIPKSINFLPDWVWSYRYPHRLINECIIVFGGNDFYKKIVPTPVYSSPVYEISIAIVTFLILWSFRKILTTPGTLFSMYLMLAAFARLLIERIHVNTLYDYFGTAINQAELTSLLLFISGAILFFYQENKYRSIGHS